MMTRWLLDQGLPRTAETLLRKLGEDALHVGSIGMADASDSEIIQKADADDRIIVTLDSDFHSLLSVMGASKPSVVRIREEGLRGPQVSELVLRIRKQFESELAHGCIMTLQGGKIRYRMLPL